MTTPDDITRLASFEIASDGLNALRSDPELRKEADTILKVMLDDRPKGWLEGQSQEQIELNIARMGVCVGLTLGKTQALVDKLGGFEKIGEVLKSEGIDGLKDALAEAQA